MMTRDLKVPTQGANTKCTSWLEDRIQVWMKKAESKIDTEVTLKKAVD